MEFELRELLHGLVQRVEVEDARILLQLDRKAIVSRLTPEAASKSRDRNPTPNVDPRVLSIVANSRRAGKGVRLVIAAAAPQSIDSGLVALIARAFAT